MLFRSHRRDGCQRQVDPVRRPQVVLHPRRGWLCGAPLRRLGLRAERPGRLLRLDAQRLQPARHRRGQVLPEQRDLTAPPGCLRPRPRGLHAVQGCRRLHGISLHEWSPIMDDKTPEQLAAEADAAAAAAAAAAAVASTVSTQPTK